MTCIKDRDSGSFTVADWQKRNKYTDNTAVDDLNKKLNQEEIFNRLTNNGVEQGVYMKDGKLYLNFTYALGGVLKLGGKIMAMESCRFMMKWKCNWILV